MRKWFFGDIFWTGKDFYIRFFAFERYCQKQQDIKRTIQYNEKQASYSRTRKNRVFDVFRTLQAGKMWFFELDISDKVCR